jgi:hypothetical protein
MPAQVAANPAMHNESKYTLCTPLTRNSFSFLGFNNMNTTFQPTFESAQPSATSKDLTLNNYLQ